MAEEDNPFLKYVKPVATPDYVPVEVPPGEENPFAKFVKKPDDIVVPSEPVPTDPMGTPLTNATTVPTTRGELDNIKQELGKVAIRPTDAAGKFQEGIPILGAYANQANAGIDAAASGIAQQFGLQKPGDASPVSSAPTIGGRYDENLKKRQERSKKVDEESPYGAAGAKAVGAIISTLPAMAAAPIAFGGGAAPAVVRAAASGATGAGIGAADAAARGENVGVGAAVGGITGAVAPVIGKGLGMVAEKLTGGTKAAGGPLANIDPLALSWAKKAAKADGLTDAEVTKKFAELGEHGFMAEYGPNMQELAGGVVASPGGGKTAIVDAYRNRAEGTRDRIEKAIEDVMGPRINVEDLTRAETSQRAIDTKPLYAKWETTQIHPTKELQDLIPRLQSVGAFSQARQKAAAEGINWEKNYFTPGERKNYPTAKSWDYVKRALDDRISGSFGPHGENTDWTRIYTGLKKDLMSAIKNSNGPGAKVWEEARQAWGDPTSIMHAREEGSKIWTNKARRDALEYQLTDYSQPERDAFKQGARDSLAEMIDNGRHGDRRVRDLILSPAVQDKLKLIANNKKVNAQTLIDRMEQENIFSTTKSDTLHNSKTAARTAMQKLITPDPSDTWSAWVRHAYSPHVTPGVLIPKAFEHVAEGRQAAKFEAARDALAPLLTQQGPQAEATLRALLAHQTHPTAAKVDPAITSMLRLLSAGAQPNAQQRLEVRPSAVNR